MSSPTIGLITPDQGAIDRTVRALKSSAPGIEVIVGHSVEEVVEESGEDLRALLIDADRLRYGLAYLRRAAIRTRVVVLAPETLESVLDTTLEHPDIIGVMAWTSKGARPWEMHYLARRIVAPNELPPHFGDLMPWGSTTVAWQPSTTEELRQIVVRIEGLSKRLGVGRRAAAAVSTAAHELLMNAMYDAPVDSQGNLKYALDRQQMLNLPPEEVPTLRFTVSGDVVALDAMDPFGRLPRNRFFESVLRGHRGLTTGTPILDTSYGGAGLGLHTLYTSGTILRAELIPTKLTHVSWVYDRSVPIREQRNVARSLYYVPLIPRR